MTEQSMNQSPDDAVLDSSPPPIDVRATSCNGDEVHLDLSDHAPDHRVTLHIHTPRATVTLPPPTGQSISVHVVAMVALERVQLVGAVHQLCYTGPHAPVHPDAGNNTRIRTARTRPWHRVLIAAPEQAVAAADEDVVIVLGGRWHARELPRPAVPHGVLMMAGCRLPASVVVRHHHQTVFVDCTGMRRLSSRTYSRLRLHHAGAVVELVGILRRLSLGHGASAGPLELLQPEGDLDRVEVRDSTALHSLRVDSVKNLVLRRTPNLVELHGKVGEFVCDAESMCAATGEVNVSVSLRMESLADLRRALEHGLCGRLAAMMRWIRRTPRDQFNSVDLCWQAVVEIARSPALSLTDALEFASTFIDRHRQQRRHVRALHATTRSSTNSPPWHNTAWDVLFQLYERDPDTLHADSVVWTNVPDPAELATVSAWLIADTESANPRLRFCRAWIEGCHATLARAAANGVSDGGLVAFSDSDYAPLVHAGWHNLIRCATADPWMAERLDAWLDLLVRLVPPLVALPVVGPLIRQSHPRADVLWTQLSNAAIDATEPGTATAVEVARTIIAQRMACAR